MSAVSEDSKVRRERNLIAERLIVPLSLTAFTAFYFVDVCLRASGKFFWYDELLTLYFARLPNLHSLWGALQTGVESNPPGFHLLTRATETLWGEGLIATRLPEIVSFWVLCICLFMYVRPRAGTAAALLALTFPMTTGAYYYAYEARPLIIVVCLGAIALLCFDYANRSGKRTRWLLAFSAALLAAFVLHCYAILLIFPFALVEVTRASRFRIFRWDVWIAMFLPALVVFPMYLSILKAFSAVTHGTNFAFFFPPNWGQLLGLYSYLLAPGLVTLLTALVLFSVNHGIDRKRAYEPDREDRTPYTGEDALLAAGFIAIPVAGVLLGKALHSTFFGRYFLSALIGIVIVISVRAGLQPARKRVASLLLCVTCCTLLLNFARLMHNLYNNTGEILFEPSTSQHMGTTRGEPLEWYPLIQYLPDNSLPVVLLDPANYLYLYQYAPRLAGRLNLWAPDRNDATIRGIAAFQRWSPLKYKPPLIGRELVNTYREFYVYGGGMKMEELGRLASMTDIKSVKVSEGNYLMRMQAKIE